MRSHKALLLVVSVLLLVNYINYFLPDRDAISNKIFLLEEKIAKEHMLKDMNITEEKLKLQINDLFFDGDKLNYSMAMNTLQQIVNDASKDNCKIDNIYWQQSAGSKEWYETLQLDLFLECSPKGLFMFFNSLREERKLLKIEALKVAKANKRPILKVQMKVKAYRIVGNHSEP